MSDHTETRKFRRMVMVQPDCKFTYGGVTIAMEQARLLEMDFEEYLGDVLGWSQWQIIDLKVSLSHYEEVW